MKKLIKLDRYVVVGGNSWGKDPDLETAFWNWFKNERPKRDLTLHVRQVNEEAYVDEMGTLYAHKASIKLPDIKITKKFIDKYADVMGDLEELLQQANDESSIDAFYDGVEVEDEAA